MAEQRYSRWQGLAIAQLTVAVALISGLSVAGLGLGMSLLQNKEFMQVQPYKLAFGCSMLLLLLAALFSCSAVITRLLDFRLTARKVRKDRNPKYDRPLTIFWLGPEPYSRATWGLFWACCLSFAVGAVVLVTCIGAAYAKCSP